MAAGKPGESEQGVTIVLLMGLLAAIGYGVWYFFHAQIIEILRAVRWGELRAVSGFAPTMLMPDGTHIAPAQLADWLGSAQADHLSWDQMAALSKTIVPQFLRWPCAVLLLALAGLAHGYAPRRKLRHVFKLEDLIKIQSLAWPVITPITKINPAAGPQRAPGDALPEKLPLFAESLSPEEFVAFNHIPVVGRMVDREAATRAFTRQLGPRWQGWDKLPTHYRALAAVFAIKGARQREEADKLIGDIARCWSPGAGLVLTGKVSARVDQILRDPKWGGEAAKIMAGHAFAIPGMFRLLIWARERGGVLAPATFLWLRGVDRSLWYPLNNAGRRTFHPEAAGAAAHYYAEKFLRRPLSIPKVQGAVDALADYIKDSILPIPETAPSAFAGVGSRERPTGLSAVAGRSA